MSPKSGIDEARPHSGLFPQESEYRQRVQAKPASSAPASRLRLKGAKCDSGAGGALVEQVERSIMSRGLIGNDETLVVAVSGGVDSMVLLHLLHEMAPRRGWSLVVVHLNHQLRGRSSVADATLVRTTARRLKLKCVAERADIRRVARRQKVSIEMAARQVRHEFLARTARRFGAVKIVLAHHADDQVELFFLRLFRGSGSEGLAGMKWRNPSPQEPGITLIRPLLQIPKTALNACARARGIPYREDATNEHLDIPRNRIRHKLLPFLKRNFQPQLHKVVSRAMDILGAESDQVSAAAHRWLAAKAKSGFGDLPVAIQRRVLQIQCLSQGVFPEFDQLEALRLNPGTVVEFSPQAQGIGCSDKRNTVRLKIDVDGRLRTAPRSSVPFSKASVKLRLSLAQGPSTPKGRVSFPGRKAAKAVETAEFEGVRISWEMRQYAPRSVRKPLSGSEIFDADRVGGEVVLRHWQPGDRFQPIGMKQSMKLQDCFGNAKTPREDRHRLIVGVGQSGEIFWVEGFRISERFKLTDDTTRSLHWTWKRL